MLHAVPTAPVDGTNVINNVAATTAPTALVINEYKGAFNAMLIVDNADHKPVNMIPALSIFSAGILS